MSNAAIPENWKVGRKIPLAKPGKDPKQAKSYRPIALLSPVASLIERLLLPDFNFNVDFQEHQHGFRKERSKTTELNCISIYI